VANSASIEESTAIQCWQVLTSPRSIRGPAIASIYSLPLFTATRSHLNTLTRTWRVKVGVSVAHSANLTPTRNAIGLSRPTACILTTGDRPSKPVAFQPPPSCASKALPSTQGEESHAARAGIGLCVQPQGNSFLR
jgi:hypothetical protein